MGRVGAQEIESTALEISPAVREGCLHKLHVHPDAGGDSPAKIGVHADPGTIGVLSKADDRYHATFQDASRNDIVKCAGIGFIS